MEIARAIRQHAIQIAEAAIRAANPAPAVRAALRAHVDRTKYERIFVVGAGKASGTMARACETVFEKGITDGCVNVKDGDRTVCKRIELRPCGHPIPDRRGVNGAEQIIRICEQAGERDLVVCLWSGGASALAPYPAGHISIDEKQYTTQLLLDCGATIHELNAVRKHISRFKGGLLARAAAPARVLSLILSDVVGDDLDVIGSGPTAPDSSTFATAIAVLHKYELQTRVPKTVQVWLENGVGETPKPGDPIFERVENIIIGNNQKALEAAARKARRFKYNTMILGSTIQGETREVGRMHAAIAHQIKLEGEPLKVPACVISGGETTVTIRGNGKGGRNQEFVLAAALDIAGLDRVVVMSVGTDGTDGPTDAAGAVADGATASRANGRAEAALENNDSYTFFDRLGDLIKTGPTGTNVMDLHLVLVGKNRTSRRQRPPGSE